jgi:hypothetical protein
MIIAYLPIKIDIRLPNPEVLLEHINTYRLTTKNDVTWAVAPVIGRLPPEDWKIPNTHISTIYNRYNENFEHEPQYANNIDKIIPEIPYMISQFPFKKVTSSFLLQQVGEVTPHCDLQKKDVYSDPNEVCGKNEPRRFNILLTRHSEKSFYVCQDQNSEKIYPIITKENPSFAFNEHQCLHGAEYIGPNKVMLTVAGMLDTDKFTAMIEENTRNFSNQVITFSEQCITSVIGTGLE